MSIFDPFGTPNQAAAERSIMANTFGAFGAGLGGGAAAGPPGGIGWASYNAFHGIGSVSRLAGKSLVSGVTGSGGLLGAAMSGPFHMGRDYMRWRGGRAANMKRARHLADTMERVHPNVSSLDSIMGGATGREFRDQYGSQINPEYYETNQAGRRVMSRKDRMVYGNYKPRKFGARSPWEHLTRGTQNFTSQTLLSPMSAGINIAIAGFLSSDNLLDMREGIGARFAEGVLAETGFMGGGSMGAALGAAAVPGSAIAAGVGLLAGGLGGGYVLSQVPGKLMDFAEWGAKNGRHAKPFRAGFMDSEQAITMRQRGLQSIYRSQMSARSAIGSEALSYHV